MWNNNAMMRSILYGGTNKMKSIKRRNLLTGISGTMRSSVISTHTKKKKNKINPWLIQKQIFSPKTKQVVVKKKNTILIFFPPFFGWASRSFINFLLILFLFTKNIKRHSWTCTASLPIVLRVSYCFDCYCCSSGEMTVRLREFPSFSLHFFSPCLLMIFLFFLWIAVYSLSLAILCCCCQTVFLFCVWGDFLFASFVF